MKRTLSLALVLACLSALGQAPTSRMKAPPIPPQNLGPAWKPSKMSPAAIAKLADAKTAALRSVGAKYIISYWLGKDWGGGSIMGDIKIRNNNTFLIEYLDLHYSHSRTDTPGHKTTVKSNGKLVSVSNVVTNTRTPIAKFKIDNSRSVTDWTTGIQRNILGGIHNETPLSNLIAMASRRGSGFQVTAGERVVPFRGRNIGQRQLVVTRTKAEAAKKGPLRIEVTIDTQRGLPVSTRLDGQEKGHLSVVSILSLQWRLKPTAFPDSTFAVVAK